MSWEKQRNNALLKSFNLQSKISMHNWNLTNVITSKSSKLLKCSLMRVSFLCKISFSSPQKLSKRLIILINKWLQRFYQWLKRTSVLCMKWWEEALMPATANLWEISQFLRFSVFKEDKEWSWIRSKSSSLSSILQNWKSWMKAELRSRSVCRLN